ncbi:hypothetical protein PLESTB_001660900 [Pleodorina starrii]|uniref:EGF-like domain-containing protein n=1 Tax=Pleodorina starrii TaxID=330485 RepID=A0A9W6BYW1_9CHLO|nr:hypothetical protein PLESTB_001660900 [Pleodorina starrii]
MRPDGYPAGLNATAGAQWSAVTTIGKDGAYYTAGRYVVLYDGNGTVELSGDAAWPPVAAAAGRVVIDVTPSTTGLSVRITSSSLTDPVVNIRIVPLANEINYQQNPFHPEFLDMLKGIPLLRFSAWMWTSYSSDNPRTAPRNWTSRTTTRHSSQVRDSGDGVAVEHLVQLANAVGANMWISLPRAAHESDPYIYNMVSYIAANLSSSLSLTVEYGIDGPGWLSSHLPNQTRLLSVVARRAWADGGRPRSQLRVVMTTSGQSPGSALSSVGSNVSFIDAYALPGSFGGNAYWAWAGKVNPTYWGDPSQFSGSRTEAPSLETVMRLLRSSVIAADVGYHKSYQWLQGVGLDALAYMAGPDMSGPWYGARSNYDRAMSTCGRNTSTYPCYWSNIYPPLNNNGVPSSFNWTTREEFTATLASMAPNASREAALESVLRQARLHDSLYDIVLDSLWRWHNQTGGGDLVIDLTRTTTPCSKAPGASTKIYAPDECRGTPEAAALIVARPTGTPTYRALRAWLAAVAANGSAAAPGSLPRSSADATSPPVPRPAVVCAPACVYGSCVNGSCACWAGVSGASCDVLPAAGAGGTPSACNPRVGVNLEGISDWSRSWTFVDVFKASRDWFPQSFIPGVGGWSTGAAVSLIRRPDGPGGRTAVGYPDVLPPFQRVATLVVRDLQAHAPGGWYTILYDGKGALDFSMSDVKEIVFVEAGHIKVAFYPSTEFNNGMLVMLERTDPTDPLRNIRVLMPGYEQAAVWGDQPFHPAFLSWLRPFGLLRFMDWMHSNAEALPVEWEQRPRPEDISFASNLGGVPLEYMLMLVNMLGADPWFNMPFAASDDYIAHFAAAVRDGLRPDLRVYVEYGNELWHTGFPGGRYAQAMGLKLNTTEQGDKYYGGATNEARLCFTGQRTANISKIWKAAWGSRAAQVVVVVSGQQVQNITSDKLLSCGGAAAHIDALAVAPYFGSYNGARDTNLTVYMNTTLPPYVNEAISYVKLHAAVAAKYGKPLLAYEAGTSMTGDGSSNDLAIAANRDPAMAGVYRMYLEGLVAANVSRVVHYSSITAYTKHGSWGLMEAQDQDPDEAPKYQGLMSYLNATLTCALPAPPNASTCPGQGCSGNGQCLANGRCSCYSGFSGDDCSNVSYVEVVQCGYKCTFDQGWCNVSTVRKKTRTWSCTCKPGITGLTCGIVACPNDCSWNGECLDQGICACYPGYQGPDCGIDCGCGGHGRCAESSTSNSTSSDTAASCICDMGWRLGPSGKCDTWDCRGCARNTSCAGPGECGCTETCVYGTCFHGTCRCWAGYGGPSCNVSDAEAEGLGFPRHDFVPRLNRGSLAGINLGGTSYWRTEWIWIDVMKSSSGWMTTYALDTSVEVKFDTGVPLELRPDGYPARLPPGVIAHKLLQRDQLRHTWPGRYVVLYDGDGRLNFEYDARVASRAKGRLEIIFRPTADLACAATGAAYCGDNGIRLALTATNPANPLRNIRIVPTAEGPAASAGGAGAGGAWESRTERAPFHPWFLKSVARYHVIRFMGLMDTNGDSGGAAVLAGNLTGWEARRKPDADTQAGPGGIALEYIVQLCNLLGADPWVNVHHLADDAYVTSMATLMRDTLRPDVKIYVEHSNEVWNGLFPQAQYARATGLSLNLSTDATKAGYRYHALRTAQIASTFRSVFASAPGGGAARVRVVLGGWTTLCGTNNSGCGAVVLNETLGWGASYLQQLALGGAALQQQQQARINVSLAKPDYYGVTGYWGCDLGLNGAVEVGMSVDAMIAKCNTTLNATEAAARAVVAAAARYGVPLILYEAGPSIVESSAIHTGSTTVGLAAKFMDVNRHPAMYGLYGAYLEAFRRAGLVGEGRPWMQFVSTGAFTKYGSWGLQEYTGQPLSTAPKYRALMDWLDAQVAGPSLQVLPNWTDIKHTHSCACVCVCVQVNLTAAGNVSAGNATAAGGPPPNTTAPPPAAPPSPPPRRPLCMHLSTHGGPAAGISGTAGGGGVSLGEGLLAGPPAVSLPAAGQVVLQGTIAPIRWSTVGWAPGALPPGFEISLWYLTDCSSDPPAGATQREQQKAASEAISVLPAPAPTTPGELDVYVPRAFEDAGLAAAVAVAESHKQQLWGRRLPRFFLRLRDDVSTNYSEPFDISPGVEYAPGNWSGCNCSANEPNASMSIERRNATCRHLPELAGGGGLLDYLLATGRQPLPLAPQPACDPFPGWNISRPAIDPSCTIDENGCRNYRTDMRGAWAWSAFKLVTDCTAQSSPYPVPPALHSNATNSSAAAAAADSLPTPSPSSSPAGDLLIWNTSVCKSLIWGDAPPETRDCACPGLGPSLGLRLGLQSAQLTDDGRAVRVALSAPPAPLRLVPCNSVFEPASSVLLGGGAALCSTSTSAISGGPSVLEIQLAANATLRAGQTLTLMTHGSALLGALNTSQAFSGSVAVSTCENCASPTAALTGPSTISRTTCTSAAASLLSAAAPRPPITFDASQSSDPSGRAVWAVEVTWEVEAESPWEGEAAAASNTDAVRISLAALWGAVRRANGKESIRDRLTLSLNSTEEAALQEGVTYTLKVRVTSWLGSSDSATAAFILLDSNPAPTVTISGPAVQTARIRSGLRLWAEVAGGACKGRTLTWSWSSPSGWSGLPPSGLGGQQLLIKGPLSSVAHGQNITLRVTATYDAASSRAASGSADVTVGVSGSAPLAALSGPAGDVPNNVTLTFSATRSSDPDADPASPQSTLRYEWGCRRSDVPTTPCFTSFSRQGDFASTLGVWTLPAGLLSTDVWHVISVTLSREVAAGTTPLTAFASITLRPRDAARPFPRGQLTRQCAAAGCGSPHSTDRNLTVLLQLEPPYNTAATAAAVTVSWSSAEAAAVSSLTAATASSDPTSGLPEGAFLLTVPAAALPAAQNSTTITITANMSAAAIGSAAAASGFATVTVPLNGAPYCNLSATDPSACLGLTIRDSTFPSAAFTLTAHDWADAGQQDSRGLKYEFGVRQAIALAGGATTIATNVVQQLGTATSATLVGLPQGVVQLYGCAIDSDGSRTCGRVNVTVDPPAAGFNATATLAAINITDLIQAAHQFAQLARVAANSTSSSSSSSGGGSGGSDAAAVAEMVADMSVALVQAMLSGGALDDAEQAPQAIAAMVSLASSAAVLPDKARDAFLTAVKSAAESLATATATATDSGSGSPASLNSFVTQLCRLLAATLPPGTSSLASNSTARRALLEPASTTATVSTAVLSAWARLKDMRQVLDHMGDALGRQAVPRGPYLASGDGGVYVSAASLPSTAAATTGSGDAAKVIVQLRAGPDAVAAAAAASADASDDSSTLSRRSRRRLNLLLSTTTGADPNVDTQLVLTGDAAVSGTGYGIDLQYSPSSAAQLATAVSAALPASVSLLSGLITLTWNAAASSSSSSSASAASSTASVPPALDGSSSFLTLSIPAPGYNSSKRAACLMYNATTNAVTGGLPGLTAGGGAAATYDSATGRLSCNVSAVGTYFVAQAAVQDAAAKKDGGGHDTDGGGGDHLNVGALVGGIIGGVAGLVLLAALGVALTLFLARRRERARVATAAGRGGDDDRDGGGGGGGSPMGGRASSPASGARAAVPTVGNEADGGGGNQLVSKPPLAAAVGEGRVVVTPRQASARRLLAAAVGGSRSRVRPVSGSRARDEDDDGAGVDVDVYGKEVQRSTRSGAALIRQESLTQQQQQ